MESENKGDVMIENDYRKPLLQLEQNESKGLCSINSDETDIIEEDLIH